MKLPDLKIYDNALSPSSHVAWTKRVAKLEALSTPAEKELLTSEHGKELLAASEMLIGRELHLLQMVLFAIRRGDVTTSHTDFGEYVALYYPVSCPGGPLRIETLRSSVEVVANRLVVFNATTLVHKQVVPSGNAVRYSVALKFRYP